MTLEDRLRSLDGHPAGFDVLRLALAAAVIVQHSVNVTQGQAAADALFHSGWRLAIEPILPMFFALSGFLVAGSLFRCRSLIGFAGLRILRIVPALTVEVGLSALLLGPVLTDLPIGGYLSAPEFRSYFLNVAGFIHYHLPGVFAANPDPRTVNAQLWTVPFELECYAALAALTVLGLAWRRTLFLLLLAVLQCAVAAAVAMGPALALEVTVPGRALVLCFLWGVALFLFRDRLPWSAVLFGVAAAAAAALMLLPGGSYLVGLPIGYATVVLGLTNPRKPALLFDGDYSYGLYLYGFPVQQTLVSLMPGRGCVANAILALIVTFGLAQLSWRLVERRALTYRQILRRVEDGVLDRLPGRALGWGARRMLVPRPRRT